MIMIQSMADLLERIGGWRVDCECHDEVWALVAQAESRGYVGRRTHYALIAPEGDPAFEVTDSGLDHLRTHRGAAAAKNAHAMRQWYRDHASRQCLDHGEVYSEDTT